MGHTSMEAGEAGEASGSTEPPARTRPLERALFLQAGLLILTSHPWCTKAKITNVHD